MRNFSIISILLALTVAAILWQKVIVNSAPERLPDPADYTTMPDDQAEEIMSDECNENDQQGFECEPEVDTTEQGEMEQQRQRGHDVMMKSFDEKLDKYKGQINGRQ